MKCMETYMNIIHTQYFKNKVQEMWIIIASKYNEQSKSWANIMTGNISFWLLLKSPTMSAQFTCTEVQNDAYVIIFKRTPTQSCT